MHKMFVYGILKGRAAEVIGARPAILEHRIMHDLGNFPAVKNVSYPGEQVHGEIVEVSDEVRMMWDAIEGHPDFYTRTKVVVWNQDQEPEEVEMYYYNGDVEGLPVVAGGIW